MELGIMKLSTLELDHSSDRELNQSSVRQLLTYIEVTNLELDFRARPRELDPDYP